MSDKTLQIFTLCEQLAQLLDDKEALSCFSKKPLLCQKTSKTSHFCVFFKNNE